MGGGYDVFYGGFVKSDGKNRENFVEVHKKKTAEAFSGLRGILYEREIV